MLGIAIVPDAMPGDAGPARANIDATYAHPTGAVALLGALALSGLGLAALAAPAWFVARRKGTVARAAVS